MDGSERAEGATIIPTLRYRDAPAVIKWLCKVFGFQEQLVVRNDDGTIAHAQLRLGTGMVMLGSAADTEFGRLIRQPDQIDGADLALWQQFYSPLGSSGLSASDVMAGLGIEVPEPASILLAVGGLFALAAHRRRHRN